MQRGREAKRHGLGVGAFRAPLEKTYIIVIECEKGGGVICMNCNDMLY